MNRSIKSLHSLQIFPFSQLASELLRFTVMLMSYQVTMLTIELQVGQWARWLSDFLGIYVDSKQKNVKKTPDCSEGDCEETECFPLLNALSDLLMLPKDMLMDRTVRLEV